MNPTQPKYYLTTPIYYATDRPHIGHAYTTVVADVIARYRRMTGYDVFFLTGTDEHGQKMERQAATAGITPRELADRTAPRYAELWAKLAITNDGFIRTTEERHHLAVNEIWRRMTAAGDIYRGEYEGLYCVSCELFYADKELVSGNCPDHGRPVERVKESGHFFRLSAFQDRLLAHYDQNPEFIAPKTRMNEVRSFVSSGLRDLSISRTTTRWGWPVPGDDGHVMYVWVDALTNYLTGVGWPEPEASRYWPADVHLVGKDILRFHAVFWPAFLLSAGVPLPHQIYSHGWWLRDDTKISKSGGAVYVEPLIERFGSDAVRYFLMREITFGLDGTYSDAAFARRYNSDLANDLGNLTQRTLQMIERYRGGVVPDGAAGTPDPIRDTATGVIRSYREEFDRLGFSRGLDAAWELVRVGNRYIDERAPWSLAKDPTLAADLDTVLYTAAELVRLAATCLWPVMPDRCGEARRLLGFGAEPELDDLAWGRLRPGHRLEPFAPLFPRVDVNDWLETESQTGKSGKGKTVSETKESEAGAPGGGPDGAGGAAAAGVEPAAAKVESPTPAPAAEAKPLLTYDEVMKLDLRVARIEAAERVPKSKKLLRLQIDLGTEKRQIVAGIAEKYAPEGLVGKSVIVVANLKPAKLMGVESQGMLLAASIDGVPILAGFAEEPPPGTQVK